jgi:hypothetical protein
MDTSITALISSSMATTTTASVPTPATANPTIQTIVRAPSSLVRKLNRDVLFMIFDSIIDEEATLDIKDTAVHHSNIGALSQTCSHLREEIKSWTTKRPELIGSPVFGLINPLSTTINLCYFPVEGCPTLPSSESVWRSYPPIAIRKNIEILERWQRAMVKSMSRSGNIVDIAFAANLDNCMTMLLEDGRLSKVKRMEAWRNWRLLK